MQLFIASATMITLAAMLPACVLAGPISYGYCQTGESVIRTEHQSHPTCVGPENFQAATDKRSPATLPPDLYSEQSMPLLSTPRLAPSHVTSNSGLVWRRARRQRLEKNRRSGGDSQYVVLSFDTFRVRLIGNIDYL